MNLHNPSIAVTTHHLYDLRLCVKKVGPWVVFWTLC